MATLLGSTAKPTYGSHYEAYANNNQFATKLTLPAGGPWNIETLGAWFAGDSTHTSATTNAYLAVWDSSGTLLGQSAVFTPTRRAFAIGTADQYQYAVSSPPSVAGGSVVYVGFIYSPYTSNHGMQFPYNSPGTYYKDTNATIPGSLPSPTAVSPGSMGVYLYYSLSNNVPNAPTLNTPANGTSSTNRTPTFNWTPSDPDADPATQYNLQVSSDASFASVTHWNYTPAGSWTNGVAVNTVYAGTTLSFGTTYYWRVRTYDAVSAGWGPYSGAWSYYLYNSAPSAPALNTPVSGTILASGVPIFNWTPSDPDGDPATTYHVEVSTDATFASITHWDYTSGAVSYTNGVAQDTVYAGTGLTAGVYYYWRFQTYDSVSASWGAWSASRSFAINVPPTTTLTNPSASGRFADATYTAGSGWASPRINIGWTYSHALSTPQASYQVFITNDADSSTFWDSGTVAGATVTAQCPTTLVEGNKYRVKVRTNDGLAWGSYSSEYTVRARWGLSTHVKDVRVGGAAPTTISNTVLQTLTSSASYAIVEWNSSHNGTTLNHATWKNSISSITKDWYAHYRVWLGIKGASPATTPSLDLITVYTTGFVGTPDGWLPATLASVSAAIDTSSRFVGSQSLRIDGTAAGTVHTVYQDVPVDPNTNYVLQSRVRSVGDSGATVTVASQPGGSVLAATTLVATDQDWKHMVASPFNSGSNTTVRVSCTVGATAPHGASGTGGFFDGIKIERGTVASPWVPGMVGDAVTLDSGGVQIDASSGGVMRLRGSAGGTRDLVELGANGLKFGGGTTPVNISSASAGLLNVDGAISAVGMITAAGLNVGGALNAYNFKVFRFQGPSSGGTNYIANADLPLAGAMAVVSDGNDGMAIASFYRGGTYNVLQAVAANGNWEFRGTTFSAGSAYYSWFLESNSQYARIGMKSNIGDPRGYYILFWGIGW